MKRIYKWVTAKKRAKRLVDRLNRRAWLEYIGECPSLFLAGLHGFALSVEMNGWDVATRGTPDGFQRLLKRFLRLARWLHKRHLFPY